MQESIRLTRGEFDAFLAAIDAPAKPNAALRRAQARYAAMVQVAPT